MNGLILAFALLSMHSGISNYQLLGTRQYAYNEIGLRTEKISFDMDGKLERKVFYFYDEDGHKIRTEKYSAEDSLMAVYEYQFNEKGEKVSSLKTDHLKGKKSKKVYFYNEAKQLIRSEYYAHGAVFKSIHYGYDKFGNQNRYVAQNAKGEQSTLWFTENKYDEKGQLIGKSRRDAVGNLEKENRYDYDVEAQISTSFTDYYTGNRPNSKRVYTYNAKGQKIRFEKFVLRSTQH